MSNALTFTLEIKATPELMGILNSLIAAIQPKNMSDSATHSTPVIPAQATIPTPTPVAQIAPSMLPPAMPQPQYAVPIAQVPKPPATQAAPTATTPGFTYDDLARAASSLMDAGKQQQLLDLLGQFHVPALTQLSKEQYGAFATALRQMGAQI